MFGFKQQQVEHTVFIRQCLGRSGKLAAKFRRRACGAQLGCDEVGLFGSNLGDELAAAIEAAKLSRFNAEAPENLEDGLLPPAELARKIADGDRFFRHYLWLGDSILTKPSQDTGEPKSN
jgi:hypothetical protein